MEIKPDTKVSELTIAQLDDYLDKKFNLTELLTYTDIMTRYGIKYHQVSNLVVNGRLQILKRLKGICYFSKTTVQNVLEANGFKQIMLSY